MKQDQSLQRYIDKLTDAVAFEMELFPDVYEGEEVTVDKVRDYYAANLAPEKADSDDSIHSIFANLCNQVIKIRLDKGLSMAKNPHEACESVMAAIRNLANPKAREMIAMMNPKVTIGDVLVTGAPTYHVTKSAIKDLLANGYNPDEGLNLHVWITLFDGTVVDPTILSTLVEKERIAPENANELMVLPPHISSDLKYVPLLIHNDFFYKVSRARSNRY
jgi:hypothetical protein